jgi:hypothetical protein
LGHGGQELAGTLADQRLAAGYPDLGDAQADADPDDA